MVLKKKTFIARDFHEEAGREDVREDGSVGVTLISASAVPHRGTRARDDDTPPTSTQRPNHSECWWEDGSNEEFTPHAL